MPEYTLGEKLLKSWLFLMLGNITRSDIILKDFINTAPYENWKKNSIKTSFYHTLSIEFLDLILEKISNHPSDRLLFKLFCQYLEAYYMDETLSYKLNKLTDNLETDLIKLEYVKRQAPQLVNHLRLLSMTDNRRIKFLRDTSQISLEEQSLWHWPFIYIDPLVSNSLYPTLNSWEERDQLWFTYLLSSEKLVDLWAKNSQKSFIHGRRQFLRNHLKDDEFMLSLFKLISLGDIDITLIEAVREYKTK